MKEEIASKIELSLQLLWELLYSLWGVVIGRTQGYPNELEHAIYYLASVVAMSGYWIGSGRQ